MTDSAEDKARTSFHQAQQQNHEELRKRKRVYAIGSTEKDVDETDIDPARVDAQVRNLYKEMLDAPIPDKMMDLVRKLADKEAKS